MTAWGGSMIAFLGLGVPTVCVAIAILNDCLDVPKWMVLMNVISA